MKNKIGLIQGSFDLLHYGHMVALEKAKKKCDQLIVALNSDKLYRSYKSKEPIFSYSLRKRMLLNLKWVDTVISISDSSPLNVLKRVDPDIFFICKEWVYNKKEEILYMKKQEKEVVILPYYKGISSSDLRGLQIENIKSHKKNLCAECHRRI